MTASGSPSLAPRPRRRSPSDSRATAACRVAGQRVVAVLEPALVEQQPVAGEHRLARSRAAAAARDVPDGAAACAPRPGGRAGPARGGRRGRRAGRGRRPARRRACQHPGVRQLVPGGGLVGLDRGLEHPGPALPVEEGAGLLGDRGDRQHHVGALGDLAGPLLQADQEADRCPSASRARAGSGRSAASTPPTTSAASSPAAAASMIWPVSRPKPVRQGRQAPDRGDLVAGPRVGDRAAAGQQPGQRARLDRAALAGPARNPRQRGAGGGGQPQRRGQPAGHGRRAARRPGSPRRRARSASAACRPSASRPTPPASASSHSGSVPGAAGSSDAARLVQAAGGVGGEGVRLLPVLAVRLAQPQEDPGGLLLGLESGQQDGRRLLQRGVGDARCRRGPRRGPRRGRPGSRPPRRSARGPGSPRRWCPARPGRTSRRRRRPRR